MSNTKEVNRSFPEEPCLWCKGTELDIWPTRNGKYQCGCYGCRSMGPAKDSRVGAIAAWNARAGINTWNEMERNMHVEVLPIPNATEEPKTVLLNARAGNGVDAGEVERLVDGYARSITGNKPMADILAARASLLEYVSKGGK